MGRAVLRGAAPGWAMLGWAVLGWAILGWTVSGQAVSGWAVLGWVIDGGCARGGWLGLAGAKKIMYIAHAINACWVAVYKRCSGLHNTA